MVLMIQSEIERIVREYPSHPSWKVNAMKGEGKLPPEEQVQSIAQKVDALVSEKDREAYAQLSAQVCMHHPIHALIWEELQPTTQVLLEALFKSVVRVELWMPMIGFPSGPTYTHFGDGQVFLVHNREKCGDIEYFEIYAQPELKIAKHCVASGAQLSLADLEALPASFKSLLQKHFAFDSFEEKVRLAFSCDAFKLCAQDYMGQFRAMRNFVVKTHYQSFGIPYLMPVDMGKEGEWQLFKTPQPLPESALDQIAHLLHLEALHRLPFLGSRLTRDIFLYNGSQVIVDGEHPLPKILSQDEIQERQGRVLECFPGLQLKPDKAP